MLSQCRALRNTFGYYAMFACIGLSVGIIGPTIPSLAVQTHTSEGVVGGIFLAGPVGGLIGTYLGGRLFDRIERGHLILGIAQLFSGVMFFLIPVFPIFWMLLLVNALLGFSNGFVNTGSNTFLMWTHREKAAPFMNGLHFFFGLGAFGAPFIFARLISGGGNYREAYWVLAAMVFLTGVGVLFLGKSPHSPHKDDNGNGVISMRPYLPVIIAAVCYLFFYVGSEITFGQWIFTYATNLRAATDAQAAYLTSGFWFAFTVGRLVSIPAATRMKLEYVIGVSLLACFAIPALLLFVTPGLRLIWIVSASLGFFMAPLWPSGYTLAGQSVKLTARMSSIILFGDVIGGMILPSMTGKLIEKFEPGMMVKLVMASIFLTAVSFAVMIRGRRIVSSRNSR